MRQEVKSEVGMIKNLANTAWETSLQKPDLQFRSQKLMPCENDRLGFLFNRLSVRLARIKYVVCSQIPIIENLHDRMHVRFASFWWDIMPCL